MDLAAEQLGERSAPKIAWESLSHSTIAVIMDIYSNAAAQTHGDAAAKLNAAYTA